MAVSRTEEETGDTRTSMTNHTGSWTMRHICKMCTPSRSRTLQTVLLFHTLSLLFSPCVAYPQFSEQNTAFSLQTIAVDAQRDTVFVGSVNRVYKLNSNLSLEQETVTGPVLDNTDCVPRSMSCGTAVSTDNFNKVLLVDDDRLIICGTVYQGVCDILSVETLSVLSNSSMTEVAVNTDYGTTVAFVGNGPGDMKTLYVGSSTSSWVRGNLWTLSSRQLPSDLSSSSLFQVYNGMGPQATNPTLIQIPAGTIDDSPTSQQFNVSYVSGFVANGFSYFIAIQPKVHNSPSNYYTKLSRVCQQDDHFYSYIELPLRCYGYGDGERTLYNLAQSAYVGTVGSNFGSADLQPGSEVLYVVFAESEGMTTTPSPRSAVCMYPLSAIDEAYWNRRLGCARQETDRTDIDWLGSRACGTSASMINEISSTGPSYCHKNENNVPLGGDFPIEARALYTHPSVLTSIAASVHREQTVIFLGDQDGQLKKLWLVDSETTRLYAEMTIDADGGMVKNGLVLTPDENHVYVMTETKVTKVPVEECELYTTFEECVGGGGGLDDVGDPYCGWCSLVQRCTRGVEFECPGVDNPSLPHRWLTGDEENTRIEKITPPNTDSGTIIMLHITVMNLPALDDLEAYQCIFGDLGDRPAAVNTTIPDRTVVTCYTPPNIPEPVDGFTQVELALRHTKTNVDVVSTDFYFYKCSTFSTCSECVAQEFGCNWCGYENLCTVNLGQCEQAGVILGSGTPTPSPTDVIGQEYCPRVDLGSDTEILIPAGIQRDIRLSVANLLAPLDAQTSGYECVFEYEGNEVSVQAYLDGDDTLVCQQRVYDYETDISSVTGTMLVTWNDVYIITERQIPVVLYKCAVDRSNCGLCLSADPKFQCGWCSSIFDCGMESQCVDNDWLIGEDTVCPDPTIREISPMSGYFAGGTYLTIKGYNLGLTAADIVSIRVAGMECIKDESSYITALQISCYTPSSNRPDTGYVEVTIGNSGGQMYVATSENQFSYVLPKITGVSPAYGPSSGGSLVSILGHNLDAGSSSIASLANGIPCQIVSAFPSEVLCLSGAAEVGTMGYVSMTVDDHYVEGSSVFEYRSDPVITRVSRFSSISSGSLELNVEGTDFDTIQWPQLSFRIDYQQLISNCSKSTSTSMVCMTPSVRDLNLTLPIEVPIANVSFLLDGVMEYTPLQNNGQISGLDETFTFVPDPVFYPFENEKIDLEFDQRNFIKISGDNLTLAYREGDVRVTIGGAPCTDVVVKQQELTCYAPDEAPPSQEEGRNTFDVRVYHGALSFLVGQVEYLPQAIPLALIVGSVAGGVLFLLVVLIAGVCIASCRKNNKNDKIFKKMEEQIGTLELTVAQECKEAFAELQTGVLSITHDIKGHGIPMLDYRSYVVKSLFPENPNHAVLKELSVAGVRKDFVQKGLWQFGQLLSNKSFLLIFIRVLEEQRTLSTKDLSNVASLLVVAFQGKMEYCTDILKALMARAIKQHVKEGEESARVFMRRGVSVVEKMVGQWLAVLLYNHLQDSAGEPLFKLFYAIKQQVEKGPVDQVTGEARYSLTEGKLIRQQVEVKQLTLKAQGPDRNTPMVEVKVLDCDTVSQTKAKILDAIYKTSPYSQRPKKEELDLEWYDRPGGKLLLFDDDALRPVEGGWRKINTLSHYQVTEGATFYLLQAQGSSGSLHSNHSSPARSYNNVNVSYNIQTPASSMSPMITLDFENANRMWHLVKPDDHQHIENGVTDRKMMAEIYLPRLLTTKTILHKFVDDLVMTIFMLNDGSSLPLAIKYLFDFLDEQAQENGITDPAIIHAWKSNSLPLRFWVNLIKNPDMIFDIHKADTVDSCLSVVAQCVMEACSVSEQQLNKNSPASKLLYAKDIPIYKDYVGQYYKDIQNMPVISDQDMNAMLAEHSQRHHYDFSMLSALNELYFGYACKYRSELISALDEDNTAIKQGHAEKIEEIERIMSKSF